MNTKKQSREDIKNIFSQVNIEDLLTKNTQIQETLLSYIQDNNIKRVCIYENMTDEVSTHEIINLLEQQNIQLYTPQIIGETEMIIIDSEYDHYEKEIDLFIVPGRAFTLDGKRLGRGKGYYDRFLSQKLYKKSKKIGICYDFQLFAELKTEKHDVSMDLIITNSTC
jgi:5-formyltetrahydrofolate cyclo-ligase